MKNVAKSLASLSSKIEKIGSLVHKTPATAKAGAKKVKAQKSAAKKSMSSKDTVLDKVLEVIRKSKDGATIANLKAKTGLESRQLSNALYKLSKKAKIKAKSRGVYTKM
jgi:predicted Rossmann fold nucleotide-binding protein DprA/Smf involved in DNA uptake